MRLPLLAAQPRPLADWLYYIDFQDRQIPAGAAASLSRGAPGGASGKAITITDSGGHLSVGADGLLSWSTTVGLADPRIDLPSVSRATGRAFYARVRPGSSTIFWAGFDNNLTSSTGEAGFRIDNATQFKFVAGSATGEQPTFASAGRANEFIEYLVVLQSVGALFYVRGTYLYPTWTLIYATTVRGSAATVYPAISTFSGSADVAALGVLDLTGDWTSDYGTAEDTSTSSGTGLTGGRADMFLTAKWTPSADSQTMVMLCRSGTSSQDDNNCIRVTFNCGTRGSTTGTSVLVERVDAGVATTIGASTAWTVASAAAGLANQVSVRLEGSTIRTYVETAAAAGAHVHSLTEATYRYDYRAKATWTAGGTATVAQYSLHVPLESVMPPNVDDNRRRQVYVDVDTGTADPDLATTTSRIGITNTQTTPSMTSWGTADGRTLANSNMDAFAAQEGIYNILVCPGGNWSLNTSEISAEGDPTNFTSTTHLDREYDWAIARGFSRLCFVFWRAPTFMTDVQYGSAGEETLLAAHQTNYATLAKNVLKRYFDPAGAKYNAQITSAKAVFWVELHGYGSYDFPTASVANYIADWEAWASAIRADSTLDGVDIGGPYNVVSAWREDNAYSGAGTTQLNWPVRATTIDDHLQAFLDGITTATDFVAFDHWTTTSTDAGSPLSYAEQLRRTMTFGKIISLYKTLSSLPASCYEMYPQVSLADVGDDYGGADYHQWVGCWFASAYYHMFKAGATDIMQWGIYGDGDLAYEGNQACNFLQNAAYDGSSSYTAGAAFPTYDAALLFMTHFRSGTALKRASSTDPMVLALASATKVLLINQHDYQVQVVLDVDGTRTHQRLEAYAVVVVSV